ncbi:NUDIX domain-containing protein [uncultured Corynebacterium sp.]|uniref:NUDIX hydrolase n=1 Tax=uncultured Corynebacterium sp. TaxID=159447 RepID=UPI0025FABBF2|nr:NUDIX domain-containing protein [uncultured Corynebacterium sp.]
MTREIRVSAVALLRVLGVRRVEVLTVRKRGTDLYQFPGGKPEEGETALGAAIREVHEETGILLPAGALHPVGRYRAPAANEAGHTVVADVFTTRWAGGTPPPAAEIAETRWAPLGNSDSTPDDPGHPLAPLMFEVFPAIAARIPDAR